MVREARRGRVAAKTGRVSALSSRGQRQICRRNAAAADLITRLGAPQLRRAAFDGVPDWAGVARGERGEEVVTTCLAGKREWEVERGALPAAIGRLGPSSTSKRLGCSGRAELQVRRSLKTSSVLPSLSVRLHDESEGGGSG